MALTDNLVSYWKLDESSGDAADSVGLNTLTNNGTVAYSAGAGKINNGVTIVKATPSWLSITDAAQTGLDITGDLSLNMWVKLVSAPGASEEYPLIWKGAAYELRYNNSTVPNGLQFRINGTGTQINTTLSNATWYMITAVYTASAGSCIIYVDGSSIGTISSLATSINNTTNPFLVGDRISTGDATVNLDGAIDEVGIWSRVLTSGEVSSLYNSGAGLQYPFAGTTPTGNFFMFMDRR